MNDYEAELDPSSVTTEEQFVVALRRLRERSGLTYKEIERRTSAEGGLPLPASTLATALHRNTVPRRDVVAALVQVCGGDVTRWLTARERLLHPMPIEPSVPSTPPTPSGSSASSEPNESRPAPPEDSASPHRPPSRSTAVFTAALAVAALAVGAVLTRPSESSDGHPQTPTPSPAASGLTLELGGLCLSERPNDKTGLIFLATCEQSFPARRLTQDGEFWRVTTQHPEFGPGCMGVVDASFEPGTPLSDDTCDRIQTDRFTLHRLAGGVQLRPKDHELCVGVKGAPAVRAQVLQLPCDEHAPGQLFTIPGH
ncbi:helix-turn-helix domain-containing protein [Actinomadura chokoriensis]|uniref:XRE family transcriptional regulator n=1 Tax=Actinomadura chokoriensis TaxID=454156 RepID=A0ABV4R8V3_9ACTN